MRASDFDSSLRGLWDSLRPSKEDLAYVDDLTGLFNYRLLTELLETKWDRLVEKASQFSLVMIDLNIFKEVNDRYGHLSGDEVLRSTAEILRGHFRDDDFIFRYGGDEFVVLLPCAGPEEAQLLGERAREAMIAYDFFTPEEKELIDIPLSFSIGVSNYPSDGEDGVALIHRADQRLYAEKELSKQHLRRRKRITVGLLAAIALVSIPLGFAYFLSDVFDAVPPIDQSRATLPVLPSPADEIERQAMLDRIEALTRELNEAHRLREEERSDDVSIDEPPPVIQQLEARIEELMSDLEERKFLSESPEEGTVVTEAIDPPSAEGSPAAPPPDSTSEVDPDPSSETPSLPDPVMIAVTQPRLLGRISTVYPRRALQLGKEAEIDLRVIVNAEGQVIYAGPAGDRVGYGFEKAALEAALASRWEPGSRDGKPVEMEASLRVTFRLSESGRR